MCIHFSDQARIADDRTALAELIVKEYLTFPVLLSETEFPKVYIVFPRNVAVDYFFVYHSLKLYVYTSISIEGVMFFTCIRLLGKYVTSCLKILRIL